MTLDALTPVAPPHRRLHDDFGLDPSRIAKRSKRGLDHDEHLAGRCLVDGESSALTGRIYKCSVCGKVFPSHQALGGHKASHRTKPPANAVGNPSNSTFTDAVNSAAAATRLHKCSTCGRSFPSGQALGGHMRKHYGGDRFNGAASFSSGGAVSYSYGNGNDSATVISHNFDLNLPASPELDLILKL